MSYGFGNGGESSKIVTSVAPGLRVWLRLQHPFQRQVAICRPELVSCGTKLSIGKSRVNKSIDVEQKEDSFESYLSGAFGTFVSQDRPSACLEDSNSLATLT